MTRNDWLLITAMISPLVLPGCLRNLSQPPSDVQSICDPKLAWEQTSPVNESPNAPREILQPPVLPDHSPTVLVSQQSEPGAPPPELPRPKKPFAPSEVSPKKVIAVQPPKLESPPEPAPPQEPTKSVKTEKPSKSVQPSEPVLEALRMILNDRHQDALCHLKKYDEPTQELFLRLLPPLAMLSRKSLDKLTQQEVAVLNDQLENLLASLRPRTDLLISRMCCCEWIKSYGVYKPLAKDHLFHTGNASQPGEMVQVYVQLRNLHSIHRGQFYETRLSSEVNIRDASGQIRWRHDFNDGKQPLQTRTPLHDYFNNYSFYVPATLPPGSYTLTIRIADETRPEHRRVTEKSISFRVTGLSLR